MARRVEARSHRETVQMMIAEIHRQCGNHIPAGVAGNVVIAHAILAASDEICGRLDRIAQALEGRES